MNTQPDNRYFALAHEKGWWANVPVTDGGSRLVVSSELFLAKLALIASEIREIDIALQGHGLNEPPPGDSGKPEGWLSEIADVYIRANDLLGACGFESVPPHEPLAYPYPMETVLVLYSLIADAVEAERTSRNEALKELRRLITQSAMFAYGLGASREHFMAMIDRKHAYNATRPHRHGDKRA